VRSIIRLIFLTTFAALSVAWCIGALGCTAAPSRRAQEKNATIHEEDINVTTEQLRLRMRSLVGPMCGEIEQSADAIMEGTTDLNLKLAALEWKMDALPAMREALFRPDPYTAAVDTAVLCYQLTDYFESGPGKQAFGAESAQAAAACKRMTDDYFKVLASGTISGDVSRGRAFAQKWAADHPIRHSISGRESALSRVFEQQFADSRALTEHIANAAATADDLTRKLDVYTDQLFRQSQWEAERLRLELVRDYHIDQAVPLAGRAVTAAERAVTAADRATATVDRLDPALERSLIVVQDVPKLVATEREAAIKAVHQEIDRQRVAAMEDVDKQRIIALKQLHDALSDHAQQLTGDLDQMTARKIDQVMARVMWMVASILGIVLIAALVGLLFVRGMLVRTRSK
jgi:hypothetical protein